MNLTRNERKELDALSKEVFGNTSRWQKLVNKPYVKLLTEKKLETVPGENGAPDTEKEVDSPILRADGAHQSVSVWRTVEEVRELMVNAKAQIDAFRAEFDRQQAEKKAKEEAEALARQVEAGAGGRS